MSLLPKDTKDFGSKEYWNTFFANKGKDAFEWYGNYTELCGLLHTYIRPADAVLVAGCGNSTLSADLYRVGYKNITNVDVSQVVIKQMISKYETECPDMVWCKDDLTQSQFSTGAFSCILDKGTLDAIFTDDSLEVADKVTQYLQEVDRLLRTTGRYVCVSLMQEHILTFLLNWSQQHCWLVRFCRCEEAERATKSQGKFSLPVFVVVCTKLVPLNNFKPVVESCLDSGTVSRPLRITAEELATRVRSLQQYSAITHALITKVCAGEEARMELCEGSSGDVRYVLYILDAPSKARPPLPMGVFIVPQRREMEWLFSSAEGRRQVLESAGTSRLVMVHLVRGQLYEAGLKQVQDELSGRVMDLAPQNMPAAFKVPFLSVGGDVGSVSRVAGGSSAWCGPWLVEDVQGDGGATLRRLVFLDNPNVVQSEVCLLPEKSTNSNTATSNNSKKKKQRNKATGSSNAATRQLDHSYLSCSHHLAMVGGLGLVGREARVLLVGLGGGPLATFVHNNLSKVRLDTVELDSAMVEVARQWFGFKSGPRLTVTVMDGLDYCRQRAQQGDRYDCIMLDVDSKDVSVGMSCPPQAFVERDFLQVLAACLQPDGVLILNMVCRDKLVWQECVATINSVFGRVLCQSIPSEVNRVLFCRRPADEATADHENSQENKLLQDFSKSLNRINNVLKAKSNSKEDVLEMEEILRCTVVL